MEMDGVYTEHVETSDPLIIFRRLFEAYDTTQRREIHTNGKIIPVLAKINEVVRDKTFYT